MFCDPFTMGQFALSDEILINGITLPTKGLGTKTIKRMGHRINVPTDMTYGDDIQIKCYDDLHGKLISGFQAWMDTYRTSVNPESSDPINVRGKDGAEKFYTTLRVDQLGLNHAVTKTYSFFNVFPTSISPPTLDADSRNTLATFSVGFAFDEYTISST